MEIKKSFFLFFRPRRKFFDFPNVGRNDSEQHLGWNFSPDVANHSLKIIYGGQEMLSI